MTIKPQAKAIILQRTKYIDEIPEDALVASGWNLIDNGACTEAEWREAVDEAINELLDEGVIRSTLIYSATPVKSLYNGMVQFAPAIARIEAPAKVSQTKLPPPTKPSPSLNKERLEELLALTLDDETGSPLELMLEEKYGNIRHGAYEIVLNYSRKLEAVSRWTEGPPADLKKNIMSDLFALEDATQTINCFFARSNPIAHLANDGL